LNFFPRSALRRAAVTSLSVGISLTLGSLAMLTSMFATSVTPSSLNTAYPVIGHPPSFRGAYHEIVIEVEVELTNLGGARFDGAEHVQNVAMFERGPKPLKFSACILTLYGL
jgi:hypothetical protein